MPLQIARQGTPYRSDFLDLRGGLNNAKSDELILPNELSDVSNYLPDIHKSGGLIKRNGLTAKSTPQSEAITSVFDGVADNYFTTSTSIRDLAGTSVDGSLTSSTGPDWARFDDTNLGNIDIFVNGAEERRSANGTTWANVSNMPNFKYIEPFNRFLFGAGHDKGRVRWSNPEDVETWDADNEIIITLDAENDITGLMSFRNNLVVFAERSFHHIAGFDEKRMTLPFSSYEIGCTSHQSVVKCRYGLFWWSDQGLIWSPDGFNVFNPSLVKIPDTIRNLNKGQYTNVHGIWNPNLECIQMYVHRGTSTTQDLMISYYPGEINSQSVGSESRFGSFWVSRGDGVTMGGSGVVKESGENKIYIGSAAATGKLFEQTGDDDVGSPIAAYFETQRESAKLGEEALKRSRRITALFIASGVPEATYSAYIDDSLSISESFDLSLTEAAFVLDVSKLDTTALGIGTAPTREEIGMRRRFRKIKHRISDTSQFNTRSRGIINKGFVLNA